jgi:hypothetical protein
MLFMEGKDIKQTGITIMLDKERHMQFSLNAMCDLEEKFGDVGKAMDAMQEGSMKAIRYLLYLSLANEDETLTEKKVGALINVNTLAEVMHKLTEAMVISMPEANEKNV